VKETLAILLLAFISLTGKIESTEKQHPSVAFSFDDGNPNDILDFKGEAWNAMIIEKLRQHKLQAVWFVAAGKMNNVRGKTLLKKWEEAGNLIANHTYNHVNYNDSTMSFDIFKAEILHCDSFISSYTTYRKIFRFPYLKAGNSLAKKDSILSFLKNNDYKQGWVTIDNSDWYINSRLIKRLKENSKADINGYKEYYINHVFEKATYYNKLSLEINKREIKHTVLLHFNLTSALFLGELIEKFEKEGWKVENYEQAIKDPVYNFLPSTIPSEQSLIWMQAKETGNYKERLRYPGEDGVYEKNEMDKAGL